MPNNKALLIGINKYTLPGNDLDGCLQDVADMTAVLKDRFRFPCL